MICTHRNRNNHTVENYFFELVFPVYKSTSQTNSPTSTNTISTIPAKPTAPEVSISLTKDDYQHLSLLQESKNAKISNSGNSYTSHLLSNATTPGNSYTSSWILLDFGANDHLKVFGSLSLSLLCHYLN